MQNLQTLIDSKQWRYAKTYAKFAPHWYIIVKPENELYKLVNEELSKQAFYVLTAEKNFISNIDNYA